MSTQKYTGSCHCGAVTYNVTIDPNNPIACNCSICEKTGALLAFVPEDQFTLLSGDSELTSYRFNKKTIDHLFCNICGVRSFARGANSKGEPMIAVNVRCLDGIDIQSLSPTFFDGKAL